MDHGWFSPDLVLAQWLEKKKGVEHWMAQQR